MRKRKCLALALAPALLALAACSSGGASSDATSSGSGSGSNVELSYWLWDANQQPGYEKCAQAFTQQNPNITIKFQQYAWADYWTKLTASFVGNAAPDVFTDHLSKYADFAGKNQIVPLDDLIKGSNYDTSVFAKGLIDPWKFTDGKTYGIPKDWDTTAFFYNADMIKDAGYTQQQLEGLTWNPNDGGTFEKLVAHLTIDQNGKRGDEAGFDKNHVKIYGIGVNPEYDVTGQMQWANFTGSLGWDYLDKNPWGTHYNLDDPDFQKTISWFYGLSDKGYMPKSGEFTDETPTQIGSGKVAIGTNGDWASSQFFDLKNVKIGVFPAPVGPSGQRASIFNGLADSISTSSKHQAEAWKWVQYLGSTACQDVIAGEGTVFPAIPSSTEKALITFKAKGWPVDAFYSYVKDGRTFLPPVTTHGAEIGDAVTPALQAIHLGKKPASSLTDVNKQINSILGG
jgi:multiple sugar transport system substrate-binding protein